MTSIGVAGAVPCEIDDDWAVVRRYTIERFDRLRSFLPRTHETGPRGPEHPCTRGDGVVH